MHNRERATMNGSGEVRTSNNVNPKVRSSSRSTCSVEEFKEHVEQHFSLNPQLLEGKESIVFDLVIDADNEEELRQYREKLGQMVMESENRRKRAGRPPQKRKVNGELAAVVAKDVVPKETVEEITLSDDDDDDGDDVEFLCLTRPAAAANDAEDDDIIFVEEKKKDNGVIPNSKANTKKAGISPGEVIDLRSSDEEDHNEETSREEEDDWGTATTEESSGVAEDSFTTDKEQHLGTAEQNPDHNTSEVQGVSIAAPEEPTAIIKRRYSVETVLERVKELIKMTEDSFQSSKKQPPEPLEQSATNPLEIQAECTPKSKPGSEEPVAIIKLKPSMETVLDNTEESRNLIVNTHRDVEEPSAGVIEIESADPELSKMLEESASLLQDIEQNEAADLADDDDDVYSQADIPDVGNIDVSTVLSAEDLIALAEKTPALAITNPVPLPCGPSSSDGGERIGKPDSSKVIGRIDAETQTSAQSSPRQEPDSCENPPANNILTKELAIGVNVITVNIPSPPLSCVSECSNSSDLINEFIRSNEVPNADIMLSTLLSEELVDAETNDHHQLREESAQETNLNDPVREVSVSPTIAPISELLLSFPKPPRPKKPPCFRKKRRGLPNGSCIPIFQARKPVGASLKRLDKILPPKSKCKGQSKNMGEAQDQALDQLAPGYCLRERANKKPVKTPKSITNEKKSKSRVPKGASKKSNGPAKTNQVAESKTRLEMGRWKEYREKTKPKNPYYVVEINFDCPKPPVPTDGSSSLNSTGFELKSRNFQCSPSLESSAS